MPLILGTNSIKDTGYDVANSVRMETNTYLTGSDKVTATSNKIGSFSFWIKRTGLGTNAGGIIKVYDDANTGAYIGFKDDDTFFVEETNSGGTAIVNLITNAVFRDTSAWYHFLVAYDTAQGTDTNRVKLYINGTQPSLGTATYPSQDTNLLILGSSNPKHEVGVNSDGASGKYYLAQLLHVDGTALSNTDTGEFDSDSPTIWKPVDVSGTTLGNNGYFLSMEDSSNFGTATGKAFTANNFTATDQSTDTCTNNGNTFQPLDLQASTQTLAEGNLKVTTDSGGDWEVMASTIGVTSGKFYFEAKLITLGSNAIIGVIDINDARLNTTSSYYIGQSTPGCGYQNNGARPDTGASFGNSYTANDIIGVAIDMDNLKVYFSKNGTFQNSGDPTSGATGTGAQDLTANTTYCFAVSGYSSTVWEANFGSPPYAISSGNADGNGFGNFEYSVPSGYFSLCSSNLAEFG